MSSNNRVKGSYSLRRTALVLALGACMSSGAVFAQSNTSGSILGQAEAGSTIVITNNATGQSRSVVVGSDGRYQINSVPVGNYKVAEQKNGVEVSARSNVAVGISSGTNVSFTGGSAANAQNLGAMEVVASALPAIDVTQMDSRTTLTADTLTKIPVQRGVTAAALLAPGVIQADSRYGNIASFGGASAAENQYYVNGYPVTNSLTGLGFTQLPFDAIDQQQILTGGYGAEFGRSTGGVVNIVTKSGTNEWKAGALVQWKPRALADSPRNIYYTNPMGGRYGEMYLNRNQNKTWATDAGVYVSGPLIKDKLFLYGTFEQNRIGGAASLPSFGGSIRSPSEVKDNRWLAKLNWNITDNHILEFTGLGDTENTNVSYYDVNSGASVGTEHDKNLGTAGSSPGGHLYIGKYTGYITDNLTVTAMYGKSHSEHAQDINGAGGANCPLVVDARGTTNPYHTCWLANTVKAPGSKDDTKAWRFDVEYQLGDHHLRAGLDNLDISNYSGTVYGGGTYWRYYTLNGAIAANMPGYPGYTGVPDGTQYVVRNQTINFSANVAVKQQAQYLEDHWQISDRWLAYLGLRNEQFSNYNSGGAVYVSQRHQLAPRLGVSWDVFGDSSLKVYANAGRYHLAIPANVAIRGASATLFSRQWYTYSSVDPESGAPINPTPITGVWFANGEDGTTVPDPRTVAAKGLAAYYQDEYILGFDKALGNDFSFGVKATYRALKSIIDDFCDSAPFESYAARNNIDIDAAGVRISGCYLFNPGKTNTFTVQYGDGSYHDWALTQADFANNSNHIGYPPLKRTYKAVDIYLEHQFADNWYGKAEYVWSKNFGDSEGMLKSDIGQTDPSVTQDWDFPELMIGSMGYLPNDRRHQLKAYGFWQMTPEWRFGANLTVLSGRPKNCIGNAPDGYDREGYGTAFFFCDFTNDGVANPTPAPRGSQGRLPWTYTLDLTAQYTPSWADQNLTLSASVFNVFAQQRATSIVETQNDPTDDNWWRVLSYQSPRFFQFQARYDFSL